MKNILGLILFAVGTLPAFASSPCERILNDVPDRDVLESWRRSSEAKYANWIYQLNEALPLEKRFREYQLSEILAPILHLGVEDSIQLQELFGAHGGEGRSHVFVTVAPGQLGEWEDPIVAWMTELKDREVPGRNDLLMARVERSRSHEMPERTLNPIQRHHRKKLAAAAAEAEAIAGQKLFTESDLDYYAQRIYLVQFCEHIILRLANTRIPKDLSLAEIRRDIEKLNGVLRHYTDSSFDPFELTLAIADRNDPRQLQELLDYAALSSEDLIARAKMIGHRMSSWYENYVDYEQGIRNLVLSRLKEAVDFYALGGHPHYVGELLHFSIRESLSKEDAEKLKNANWSRAQVNHVKAWGLSSEGRVLGLQLSDDVHRSVADVFSVELPTVEGVRHFAVRVRAEWGDAEQGTLVQPDYKKLRRIEFEEMREVSRPVRAQDGFAVTPSNMLDSFYELEAAEGKWSLTQLPTQILISHAPGESPVRQGDKIAATLSVAREFGRLLHDAFDGAPKGDYLALKLFHDYTQLSPRTIYLSRVNSIGGREQYVADIKIGWMKYLRVEAVRDLVTRRFQISFSGDVGFSRARIAVSKWTGTYSASK